MLFKDIKGNIAAKKQLLYSVKNNRIGHAQLFSGNIGCAKLEIALAYARYINCNKKADEDSCGKCSSCIKYNTLSHPDLHLIFPVSKTRGRKTAVSDDFVSLWRDFVLNNPYGSINDWLEKINQEKNKGAQGKIYKDEVVLIQKKTTLKNFESKYRIFLIWMPETMNVEGSNKLLKLLEEPPSGTVFLLVSENPDQLLPTILSRIQKTEVKNFNIEDVCQFFKNKNVSREKIKHLCNLTDYNLGRIIQIIKEDIEAIDFLDFFSKWMRLIYKLDVKNIFIWVNSISETGRQNQQLFLSYSIKMIRECIIFNFADKKLLKINKKELDFIENFSQFIHEENSITIVDKLEKSIKAIKRNANAKILFFELSLQMAKEIKIARRRVIK